MRPHVDTKVIRLADVDAVSFGPLSHYQRLTGEDGLPVFTGVQTCQPGYTTLLHWHPYVECLFVLEGRLEAVLEGQEKRTLQLGPGDMIALPACIPHLFRNDGDTILRIIGIHASPTRIVHRIEARDGP
jgi:mannose-6-phosphate isomerase-like protein (cupin superfamily)